MTYYNISNYISLIAYENSNININVRISKVNVAIIGASGYLGSRLLEYLLLNKEINVAGFNQRSKRLSNHYLEHHHIRYLKSSMISNQELHTFDYVIYLGGLTGKLVCQQASNQSLVTENIDDIAQLVLRMSVTQVLIFASTASIVEGIGSTPSRENDLVDVESLDIYSQSLYQRELILSKLVEDRGDQISIIGLRLATVVGVSPNQRMDDISLNLLVRNAFLDGYLTVTNAHIYRSILWMEDFIRAIEQMVLTPVTAVKPGFHLYNMASIHGTIAKFANHIAWRTGARVIYNSEAIHKVGFTLNTAKFSSDYNFTFTNDTDIVIQNLIDNVRVFRLKDSITKENNYFVVLMLSLLLTKFNKSF